MNREMYIHQTERRFTVLNHEVTVLLDGRQTDGACAIVEQEIRAGGGLPFLHTYPVQTTFYVLAGAFTFYQMDAVGKKRGVTVPARGVIHVPCGVACGYQNSGREDGTLLTTFEPAGKMERLFADLDKLVAQENPARRAIINDLIGIFQRHQLRLFEAPLVHA